MAIRYVSSRFRLDIIPALTFLLLIGLGSHVTVGFFGEWGPDLEGPWCATRPPGEDCCIGRDDLCAVPILGTECYCDIFCNETAYDCCPDYWGHCHGVQRLIPTTTTQRPAELPTPRPTRTLEPCMSDGKSYKVGESTTYNCNTCTCQLFTLPFRRYEWTCTDDECLIRPDLIETVNDGPYTWKASNYSKLWGLTLDEGFRYRLGTFRLADNVLRMTPIRVLDDVLPESFDAREKWPNLLHPIRDQGNCASSWAHSTTAVASDRLTIETNGAIKEEMSAQHLLSCNTERQEGCEGGHLDRAWWYLRKHGVVTEQCYPYVSGQTDEAGQCLISPRQKGGACPSGIQYKTDKRYKATPPYRIRPLEREIKKEIMDNGPVQATMLVREDFFMYSRGIYSHSNTSLRREDPTVDFHSVRILGWGAERTMDGDIIKYWICANSWGTDWGENGYFRILRGVDESQIERSVVGVWGKITGDSFLRALLLENRRRRLKGLKASRQLRRLTPRGSRRRHRRRHALLKGLKAREDKKKKQKENGTKSKSYKHKKYSKKHKKNKFSKSYHTNSRDDTYFLSKFLSQ